MKTNKSTIILGLVCLTLAVFVRMGSSAAISDDFASSTELDSTVWSICTKGNAAIETTAEGLVITREKNASASLQGTMSYALKPEKEKILRLTIKFADKMLITKNAFYFGVQDEEQQNGILIQTGEKYGWGSWGVTIKRDNMTWKGKVVIENLNSFPGGTWFFDIYPGAVKIFRDHNNTENPDIAVFDSEEDMTLQEAEWFIPAVAMTPFIMDESTGIGEWGVAKIKFEHDLP